MKKTPDAALVRRAAAGTVPLITQEILEREHISNSELRVIIMRFFYDEEAFLWYQRLVTQADENQVKLWNSSQFKKMFREELPYQVYLRLQSTQDTTVWLGFISLYKSHKSEDDAVPLEDFFDE